MAVYISTLQNTGMTLVATMEKIVGGDLWNNTTFAFEASPSFADASITLTEGSSQNLGVYTGSPVGSVGSPGWVRIRIHDTSLSNVTIGVMDCYVQSSNEVSPPSPTLATQSSVDDLPTNGELATALSGLATTTKLTAVEGNVDAIKVKTDNLPATPASQGDVTTVGTAVSAISTTIGVGGAGLTGIPKTGYKLAADGLDASFGNSTAAALLGKSANTIVSGTVDHTAFTATTTIFESDDITTSAADHYKNRVVIFTSGTLANQACQITASALTSGRTRFTVSTLTSAPDDNATFIIV